MADDLSEKIRAILSDPSSAAKISAIASSLGMAGNGSTQAEEVRPSVPAAVNSPLPPVFNKGGNRNAALLSAIKPFLREEKQSKLDSLITAMSVAEILSGIKKGGGL